MGIECLEQARKKRAYLFLPYGRLLEILRERGSQKPKFLKESMQLNWNFQRGGDRGVLNQKPSVSGVLIFY